MNELPLDPDAPTAVEPATPDGPQFPRSFEELFGGAKGVIDSAVPPIAFVAVNFWKGLDAAIWTAVGVAVALFLWRLVRREPLRHTFSGALGILIAAAFARYTGTAKGYFGPGIAINAVYATVFVGSVLVRKPIIGVLYKAFKNHPDAWFEHPRVRSAYSQATLLWGGMFLSRVVVQSLFYKADKVGWLAATKVGMGWPLTLAVLAVTVPLINRRTAGVLEELEGQPS